MTNSELVFSVSDFVAVFNQTLEFGYPSVSIVGELANFRVSKNRWVYFDLKDELSSVKFFGTVYNLPGPLEDGLMVQVTGSPRLHNLYGFNINVQTIQPVGEGSIKKAAALLEAKLALEGLFDAERKRTLPYPPKAIGLVASSESAAYHDFLKILNSRWSGVEVLHVDVQVQGDAAPAQIVKALEHLNTHQTVDVIVMTRGGGSAEDLAAFSTEQVTRAVAASRVPTIVAIGHEIDISLAELAADQRASTPSNAAELLVPDKKDEHMRLIAKQENLGIQLEAYVENALRRVGEARQSLTECTKQLIEEESSSLRLRSQVLEALSPLAALKRGYAIVTIDGKAVRSIKNVSPGKEISVRLHDGTAPATISSINKA